ncbi:hypothetical protein AMTR_s00140p00012850 [Amborella trichopoda]|uniref:Uncharacterized protein n=1 Tax=Amborella trichopoda TaxID=13333 RepID=W1PA13_AMBTC|nr:hypothetical protein AMTR_s00140p00012850 [Amborella trichopoda]
MLEEANLTWLRSCGRAQSARPHEPLIAEGGLWKKRNGSARRSLNAGKVDRSDDRPAYMGNVTRKVGLPLINA